MKSKFAFLLFVAWACSFRLAAQTELSRTGTLWYVANEEDNLFGHKDYYTSMDVYRLGSDTVMDGEAWKLLYFNGKPDGTIRKDGGEVWYNPLSDDGPTGHKPRLLYDFSMQAGDRFYQTGYLEGGNVLLPLGAERIGEDRGRQPACTMNV